MFGFFKWKKSNPKLAEMRRAVSAGDGQALELLRDHVDAAAVSALSTDWSPDQPWPLKDAMVALLMDQPVAKYPVLRPLMVDALGSPTVETRAYALCSLTGDWAVFDTWLSGGWVDASLVDGAIDAWRLQR
jgi:hypothetical protein